MEVLAKENYEEYLCFCREKNAHFMQTPQWAGVKAGWKSDIIVLRQDGKIRAGALLLLRKIPGMRHFLLYVPRGPVCQKQDLQQLMQDIFHYARSHRAFCIKIDPYVPAKDGWKNSTAFWCRQADGMVLLCAARNTMKICCARCGNAANSFWQNTKEKLLPERWPFGLEKRRGIFMALPARKREMPCQIICCNIA